MSKMTLDDVDRSLQSLILSIGEEEEKEEKYRRLKASAKKAREKAPKVPAENPAPDFDAAIDDIRSAKDLKPNIYEAREVVIKTLHDAELPGYGADRK